MEPVNLPFAWCWFVLGGVTGAVQGLRFHREEHQGGYGSWRRRLMRLGHIAFFGTGLLNLGYALTVLSAPVAAGWARAASPLLIVGAVTMSLVCYLSAWRVGWRRLFFVPVLTLTGGVVCTAVSVVLAGLRGGA